MDMHDLAEAVAKRSRAKNEKDAAEALLKEGVWRDTAHRATELLRKLERAELIHDVKSKTDWDVMRCEVAGVLVKIPYKVFNFKSGDIQWSLDTNQTRLVACGKPTRGSGGSTSFNMVRQGSLLEEMLEFYGDKVSREALFPEVAKSLTDVGIKIEKLEPRSDHD